MLDFAGMMKYLQIIVVQNQTEGDLDIGVILLKSIHFNGTIASDNTDGVENGSFAGIVLAHEDQGIFNISHPQITDRFIILDLSSLRRKAVSPFHNLYYKNIIQRTEEGYKNAL